MATVTSAGRQAWLAITELLSTGDAHELVHETSASLGLTAGLLRALREIPDGQGMSMGRLAELWRCDASYVTAVIDGLEARGLAKRRADRRDRRVKHVVVTAAGRRVRDRADKLLAVPPPAFKALSGIEQRQLRDLMHKVVNANTSFNASA